MTRKSKSESFALTAWESWREAALSGTYDAIPQERIEAMFTASSLYGPANCWTGTSGELATMIRQLLREREWLLKQMQDERDERINEGMERDLYGE